MEHMYNINKSPQNIKDCSHSGNKTRASKSKKSVKWVSREIIESNTFFLQKKKV